MCLSLCSIFEMQITKFLCTGWRIRIKINIKFSEALDIDQKHTRVRFIIIIIIISFAFKWTAVCFTRWLLHGFRTEESNR